ncbi:hypothetical protein FACS1894116_13470 [Betaproteobacteria bacterium]|nr:hypothetical protein FACS1894116_13470 [Betaproteobacteria bacterium]GHU00197.1 hypothetical protein FACS1894154_08850 [Betaproteobacteria bacterium]GHU22407.1 hypothetical protein FACS189488_02900 [Betaproteobacteria bacterium]
MKGLKFNTVNPRRQALVRAGGAVAVALVLLLVALWFEARPQVSGAESAVTEVVTLPPPAPAAEAVAAAPEATAEAAVAETPPEAAVEAPPKPVLADGYMVQLGVFGAMDNAETLRKNVAARNLPVRIESRVVVGPFNDKAEAEAMREQLRRESVAEGIVVPPRNVSVAASPAVTGAPAKATVAKKPAKAQKKRQEKGPVRGRAG